jgi:site-specific DNA-methyltransferase (cytosine-N4-specific)
MREMAAGGIKAQCIVTSPPYWGLRDYGVVGAIGLEPTLQEWLAAIAEVFDAAWDVLADDGVLWLNLGDAYANDGKWGGETGGKQAYHDEANRKRIGREKRVTGLKPKDLMGQPWRVAFALQESGWTLRADCIWHKLNPMPESVTDRPTKAHEYIFMLSKGPQYYFDAEAVKELASPLTKIRNPNGRSTNKKALAKSDGMCKQLGNFDESIRGLVDKRNVRTVWSFPTERQPEAHFATFPTELVERCVLASTRPGDVVLDPFMGSGTTARVALSLSRQFIGCELNQEYVNIQDRIGLQIGMAV